MRSRLNNPKTPRFFPVQDVIIPVVRILGWRRLEITICDLQRFTMNLSVTKSSVERIEKSIYLIRGERVMLDRDLAELYGVETRVLNQSVNRNLERFPSDFMFALTRGEIVGISQFVTSSNLKFSKKVTAFSEQGVAMLSSVLRSKQAIAVNVETMGTVWTERIMSKALAKIPLEQVERAILLIRGEKVMIDSDLASLYGITTKRLNEQVKRNRERFPERFHVSAYQRRESRGGRKLRPPQQAEVLISSSFCVYGTWRDHGCKCFEQ
jgi:hypothetical protein